MLAGGADRVPADRRLRAFLINLKNGESTDVVVSLRRRSVVSARTVDTAAEGQLPIVDSEYHLVEEIMHADPGWQEAMARRGLTDMSKIRIARSRRAPTARPPRTTSGGWCACSASCRRASTTWPGRTRSTGSPRTWT